jgi:hypothetical protein
LIFLRAGPPGENVYPRDRASFKKISRQFNGESLPSFGTVIALDPDIPPELQKIFFISQANEEGLRWVLNGHTISRVGSILPWTPETGTHVLTLCDRGNEIIDSVNFEVRGPPNLPPLPFETVSQ